MLRNDLLGSGITADHIITMGYTSEDFDDGMTDKDMYNSIKEHMTDERHYYLLLDEVQEINGWEKAVNSLLENANTDIYVTGSNSKLMSSMDFSMAFFYFFLRTLLYNIVCKKTPKTTGYLYITRI